MARPRKYDDRIETTVRLPRMLHDRLKRYTRGHPMNPVIEMAIGEFLDQQDKLTKASQGATGPFDWRSRSNRST